MLAWRVYPHMIVSTRMKWNYLLGAIEAISALVNCQWKLLSRGWMVYRHRCDHRKHEEPDHDSHPDEAGGATTAEISTGGLVRCVCTRSDIPIEQSRPVGEEDTFLLSLIRRRTSYAVNLQIHTHVACRMVTKPTILMNLKLRCHGD